MDRPDRCGGHPPARPRPRLTSRNRPSHEERRTRARGTPPTRRDSRATAIKPDAERQQAATTPDRPHQDHERSRLAPTTAIMQGRSCDTCGRGGVLSAGRCRPRPAAGRALPGSSCSRPACRREGQLRGRAPCGPGRIMARVTVLPFGLWRMVTSSQTRRAACRPVARPPGAGAAGGPGGGRPLSRTSASAAAPPATCSLSRASGDPRQTALLATWLTAVRKSPARRPRRPACTAHSATARRTRRRSPAPKLAAYGAAARGVPACPGSGGTNVCYHPPTDLKPGHHPAGSAPATGLGRGDRGRVAATMAVGRRRSPSSRRRTPGCMPATQPAWPCTGNNSTACAGQRSTAPPSSTSSGPSRTGNSRPRSERFRLSPPGGRWLRRGDERRRAPGQAGGATPERPVARRQRGRAGGDRELPGGVRPRLGRRAADGPCRARRLPAPVR
jgi:hypothetical protein